MKEKIKGFICCVVLFASLTNIEASAAIDPKAKILGVMAGYGTCSGILLGAASMAFKSNGRAIFQGASIGLWAGLLFGGYVVVSHQLKQNSSLNYKQQEGEYYPEDDSTYGDDDSGASEYESGANERWRYRNFEMIDLRLQIDPLDRKTKNAKQIPVFYMNLLTISF